MAQEREKRTDKIYMKILPSIKKIAIDNAQADGRTLSNYIEQLILADKRGGEMKKYLVVDDNTVGGGMDVFVEVKDTLEEANKEAENQWDHLTKSEQKRRHVFVLDVKESDCEKDDEGNVEWEFYHQGGYEEGRFDSEKLVEK